MVSNDFGAINGEALHFPYRAVDRSIVVFAPSGFVIAAEIDPDEPSAVAACDGLTNFASH